MLIVGRVYKSGGRLWRCGLVNFTRARLDPISAVTISHVNSGKPFSSYGQSANVSPNAELDEVDVSELSEFDLLRFCRLEERESMADKAVAMPGMAKPETKGERLRRINAEESVRLEQMRAEGKIGAATGDRQAAMPSGTPKTNKGPQPKDKLCKCGCGQATAGYFFPGHDARFKGWLLKIERGLAKPEDLLTPEVRASYTWRKTEKGLVPTTNYKGEPHAGYEK